ncbi:hypothetical protein [Terrisporobacter sp.]|uniref:hypothetical protein n=1 Tax=Terrisporobacter sp. TaxID=1965305 RepID=UPI002637BE10|nr:hypothetical protein [Terrisporobacter sp.]
MNNKILNSKNYRLLKRQIFKDNKICILTKDGYSIYGIKLKNFQKHQMVKGICLNSKKEIETGTYNTHIISQNKDVRESYIDIVPLNTAIEKLIKCQPELIIPFGVREEDIVLITEEGRFLKDNINLFLNRYNVHRSFRGFTLSLREELEKAINDICIFIVDEKESNFVSRVNKIIGENEKILSGIKFELDENKSIKVSMNLEKCTFEDVRYSVLKIGSEYDKYRFANDPNSQINDRIKRYTVNIIKTYLLGIDILLGNGISTYMPKPIFDEILNNKFTHKEILEMIDEYDRRFIYASNNSKLQEEPDYNKINELVDELNRRVLNDEV